MLENEIREHNKMVKSKTDFNKKSTFINDKILKRLKDKLIIDDYFNDDNFVLINGECIKTMNALIEMGVKVNHIIADIPYGTVQGLQIDGWKNKGNVPTWDCPINIADMLDCCFNISMANSNLILFSQEPMTFKINYEMMIFQKYVLSNKMIWVKNNHANGFSAKTTPLNYYEEMLLIRKSLDESNSIELRAYFKKILEYINISKKEIINKLGQGLDHCFRYANRTFYIPTAKNYNALIKEYKIDKMDGFMEYDEIKKKWQDENDTVFNLQNNEKILKNVFEYKKDTNNIHPTQKPLLLLEKLISVFTNEDDYILDFTCGSSSTGIAAINRSRKFIGIELDKNFYIEGLRWYKKNMEFYNSPTIFKYVQ